MFRLIIALVLMPAALGAAEWSLDFSKCPLDKAPPGFRSTVSGEGKPGDWRVILDEAEPAFAPITSKAPAPGKRPVLAQLAQTAIDEHFPMLIFEEETFGDFTATTRFKTVSGRMEQMAGLAFRIQDEKNYYYVRASSKGNSFRFFKLVNGERSAPIGPEISIPANVWHELTVECRGNTIRCLLNGKEAMPVMTDTSFSAGKIGFWTKSDSVSYFADTKVVYTPRERAAQVAVRDLMTIYPRLFGIQIFAKGPTGNVQIIASNKEQEVGNRGEPTEENVLAKDAVFFGKDKKQAIVTMPMRDRNGETVAAIKVYMSTFKGQTEQNALARALPIVKEIEARLRPVKTILE